MEQILRAHAARYPDMEPADAVKLLYQNEFGGGHLIRDEQACLRYLEREYALVEKDGEIPRYEAIGNGILRVNLAALEPGELNWLGRAFIASANEHQGSLDSFLEKLEVLKKLTAQGVFCFGSEALDTYLTAYAQAMYPAVSHSDAYRAAHKPAYRVILEKYRK